VSCLLGSFGLFFTMFCLFVRFLPMVASSEVKTVLPQADPHGPERGIKEHRAARPARGAPEPAPGGAS
jgi:molybdopterin-containing oxidoreductase family membrane subunit